MKEYAGCLEHFVVIQCDYDNAEKIRNLLDANDDIEGAILEGKAVVLTSCPECGDDEFWYYGKCGHCGYEI